MINPFRDSGLDFPECPFRLYTLSIEKTFKVFAEIEKDLINTAILKKGDYELKRFKMNELCSPFLNIIENQYKSLGFNMIIKMIQEIPAYNGNDAKEKEQYQSYLNNLNRLRVDIEKGMSESDAIDLPTEEILEQNIILDILSEVKEYIEKKSNMKMKYNYIHKQIHNIMIDLKYDYLINKIKGKSINQLLNDDCSISNDIPIDINSTFPYLEAHTIIEWENFIKLFCKMKLNTTTRCLVCEKNNQKSCIQQFIPHLKKIYIQQYGYKFSLIREQ